MRFAGLSPQPNNCGLGEKGPRPTWSAAVGVFLELGGHWARCSGKALPARFMGGSLHAWSAGD